MKHKIVEVKNMIKTEQLLDNLLNRSSIVPGIGLIHGPSGFGKTTAVEWLFNQDEVNGIYVRCYKADTVTSLLEQIAKEIGIPQRHNLRAQVDSIVEAVRAEELAIFVDEADYVVGNARIMETLRDIYDATEQPLILVGMLTRFFGANRSFIEGFRIWKFALFAGLAFTVPYYLIASILGPEFPSLVGGITATYLGWRWVYLVSVVVAVAAFVLLRGAPESRVSDSRPLRAQ